MFNAISVDEADILAKSLMTDNLENKPIVNDITEI